ncbi:hypothetical protein RJ641_025906 [Dillenia turbinata]|uniref:Uncharacterized protein n=1 Tax=Dillenia turbinata TaxID=194707 RepID=A0AAN8ZKH7_9MAGN
MSESELLSSDSLSAPNIFQRANHELKETHGLRKDIDENTVLDDVKAPNVFERVKEEFEAIVQAIHQPQKESDSSPRSDPKLEMGDETTLVLKHDNAVFGETTESEMHSKSPTHHHHTETHGLSDDIDEDTPVDAVKGPNVFQRAKEELEALVETLHTRKDSDNRGSSPKGKGGFGACFGSGLEKKIGAIHCSFCLWLLCKFYCCSSVLTCQSDTKLAYCDAMMTIKFLDLELARENCGEAKVIDASCAELTWMDEKAL